PGPAWASSSAACALGVAPVGGRAGGLGVDEPPKMHPSEAKEQPKVSEAGTSSEEALMEARRAKAERLRARGDNPFANDVSTLGRVLVREIRQRCEPALLEPKTELRYDPARVTELGGDAPLQVLGRVIGRRGFGKASFLRLRDDSGEMQLFAKK